MSVRVPIADVRRMLKKCAPGFTERLATHSRVFHLSERCYPSFPKHDEIDIGHVVKLIGTLEIEWACAQSVIPQLAGRKPRGQGPAAKAAAPS